MAASSCEVNSLELDFVVFSHLGIQPSDGDFTGLLLVRMYQANESVANDRVPPDRHE